MGFGDVKPHHKIKKKMLRLEHHKRLFFIFLSNFERQPAKKRGENLLVIILMWGENLLVIILNFRILSASPRRYGLIISIQKNFNTRGSFCVVWIKKDEEQTITAPFQIIRLITNGKRGFRIF